VQRPRLSLEITHTWHWVVGFLALLWILLRSGTNPKRLTYPCQRAAMPIATGWLLSLFAFLGAGLFLKRFLKASGIVLVALGLIWFIGLRPEPSKSAIDISLALPIWETPDPISTVFVYDNIPPTTGSLAAGDATVPDEHLSDPAMDTLVALLETGGVFLHRTGVHPEGVVGADDVVIIKGNYQWTAQNTTNTDRVKGLIRQILLHPDGFTGEIIVCDNTQEIGTGILDNDNNSDDSEQSIEDVVNTFYAKGHPVYLLDWNIYWNVVVDEYSAGDDASGYVYEADTKVTYPKFLTPSGEHRVSLRYGVWDPVSETYDASRLCIIDFPVLKAHVLAGATIAVKNWVGVLTTAYADERYGGWNQMHSTYIFGGYALVARVIAVTYPDLTIVDATWTSGWGPSNLAHLTNTKALVASTDPVAASWYAAKFILTPVAVEPDQTNPDLPSSTYSKCLSRWTGFLVDSAGFACTMDSSAMSVYGREVFGCCEGVRGNTNDDPDDKINVSDVTYLVTYLFGIPTGPEPVCWEEGNANGDPDEKVNVSDVSYLLAYLFGIPSGPAPPACP